MAFIICCQVVYRYPSTRPTNTGAKQNEKKALFVNNLSIMLIGTSTLIGITHKIFALGENKHLFLLSEEYNKETVNLLSLERTKD